MQRVGLLAVLIFTLGIPPASVAADDLTKLLERGRHEVERSLRDLQRSREPAPNRSTKPTPSPQPRKVPRVVEKAPSAPEPAQKAEAAGNARAQAAPYPGQAPPDDAVVVGCPGLTYAEAKRGIEAGEDPPRCLLEQQREQGSVAAAEPRDRTASASSRPETSVVLPAGGSPIVTLSFSADGRTLLASDGGGRIRRAELRVGSPSVVLVDSASGPQSAVLAPNGNTLVSFGEGQAAELVALDHTSRRSLDLGEQAMTDAVFSPDGHILAAIAGDRLRLFDNAGELKADVDWANLRPSFTHDGKVLAITQSFGEIMLVDPATGSKIWSQHPKVSDRWSSISEATHLEAVAAAPDAPLAVVAEIGGAVRLIDLANGETLVRRETKPRRWEGTKQPTASDLTFSLDGQYVIAGLWDGRLAVWRVGNVTRDTRVADAEHYQSRLKDYITAWGIASRGGIAGDALVEAFVPLVIGARQPRVVPIAGGVVVGDDRNGVALHETATGARLRWLRERGPRKVTAIVASPDGRAVAIGFEDGGVELARLS